MSTVAQAMGADRAALQAEVEAAARQAEELSAANAQLEAANAALQVRLLDSMPCPAGFAAHMVGLPCLLLHPVAAAAWTAVFSLRFIMFRQAIMHATRRSYRTCA